MRKALGEGEGFWAVHDDLHATLIDLDEAIHIAKETSGPVILMDPADAPSAGASRDRNMILRGVVEHGYHGTALVPIVDPPAVRAAFAAGVGNTVRTTLAGRRDPGRFEPLLIEGRVRLLSDGRFISESGRRWYSGDTAVVQASTITLVVTSRSVSLHDRSLFFAHGQNPKHVDLIVVKSPHCEGSPAFAVKPKGS